MTYSVKMLAHSISPAGHEIYSFEKTYPRIIHSEEMTHREYSRNSASTRAIPLSIQLRNLLENPFIPERFGLNQPGMQAYTHLEGLRHDKAVELWLRGRDRAVTTVIELILGEEIAGEVLGYKPGREFVPGEELLAKFDDVKALIPKSEDVIDYSQTTLLNVHKQLAGRGLEAYMWHTMVWTGTTLDNYLGLRDHREAQGEIAKVARMVREVYEKSVPRELDFGEWHLPFVEPGEFDNAFDGIRASAARAAASSYNRQHVRNSEKEFARYDDLLVGGHMSPLEHQATPLSSNALTTRQDARDEIIAGIEAYGLEVTPLVNEKNGLVQAAESLLKSGNLYGWSQFRKQIPHEGNFSALLAA